MTKQCEKCGAALAVVNLATADNAAPDAPDHWLCAACFREGVNSPEARALAQADEEVAEHLQGGGHLSMSAARARNSPAAREP